MEKYALFIFAMLFTTGTAMAKDNLNGQQFLADKEGNIDIIYTVKNGYLVGEYVRYNYLYPDCMPCIKITSVNSTWHYEIYDDVNCTPIFIGTSPREPINLNKHGTKKIEVDETTIFYLGREENCTTIEGYGTIFETYHLKDKLEDITTITHTGKVKITICVMSVLKGISYINVVVTPI